MIFRRRQDEIEGFRRMREALRQQTDPQDHALLDEQYGAYPEDARPEEELAEEDELTKDNEELEEIVGLERFEEYAEEPAGAPAMEMGEPLDAMLAPVAAALPGTTQSVVPVPTAGPSMTTIGADTSWSGTLRSESNIYLEGRVEGTLEARDTIYIAERATIDARVKAHSVVVSGQFTGHVDCDGRLEITPTGRLSGEAEAGSLVVHEGAILDGKFRMKTGTGNPT